MNLSINTEIKNKILNVINKHPGSFQNYESELNILNNKSTISKELLIAVLEDVIYDCQIMRNTIKIHTIYDNSFYLLENTYLALPKHPDYEENSYIFYNDIPELKKLSSEIILSNLLQAFDLEQKYTNIMTNQSFTNRAQNILKSIESIKFQNIKLSEYEKTNLENIYINIKKQLDHKNNIDLNILGENISTYNKIATSLWNKYLNNDNKLLVHNFSRGNIKNFIPSKFLSTSLLTDKFMALFQEVRNNNYGYIVKPKKIISAYYKDTFTHNRSTNKEINMYYSKSIPPILLPWEIEDMAIKNSIDINKEILNYDHGYILPEIVLEEYEIVGIFYRSNGEGVLSPSYEAANALATKHNIKLKELDISLSRIKAGLTPMTPKMQKEFFLNILRRMYMSEDEIKKVLNWATFEKLEDELIISKYINKMYQSYIDLRKLGNLNSDLLLKIMETTISIEDKQAIKKFYNDMLQEKQQTTDDANSLYQKALTDYHKKNFIGKVKTIFARKRPKKKLTDTQIQQYGTETEYQIEKKRKGR